MIVCTLNRAFTLIEMLLATSLLLIIMSIGLKGFDYFSKDASLAASVRVLEQALLNVNTNSLTGKSKASEHYYGYTTSENIYHVSRYFLYFTINKDDDTNNKKAWEEPSYYTYGELQKTDIEYKDEEDFETDAYKIIYVEQETLPYPSFLQEILFSSLITEDEDVESLENIFVIFDPPFAKVSFATVPGSNGVKIYENINGILTSSAALTNLRMSDFARADAWYMNFNDFESREGQVSFALQYKDYQDIEEGRYNLREYLKFDSNNQISHYWE